MTEVAVAPEGKEQFKPHDKWKMFVYAPARNEWNACLYYRKWVPLQGLVETGLANAWLDRGDPVFDPEERDKKAMWAMLTSDIVLGYGMSPDVGENMLRMFDGMNPGTLNDKLLYPPSVVYDIDDNLDWVHPFNPTYACYGVHASDGRELQPGDDVGVKLANGREIIFWQDGITKGDRGWTFDITRNKDWNKRLHAFVRDAGKKSGGWTTPSKYLMKYMRETHGYPEGYVFPNSVIPSDWVTPKFAPRKKEIRILWQGGGSHASDWFYLRPAMQYIAKKYPHVKFVLWGSDFNYINDSIPEKQLEKHEWVPYDAFKPTRVLMDCDINLCVLRNDEFSRSKSAIKFYEGSMGAVPEATLAPNMPPYNEEIEDGKTGLLYDVSGTPEEIAESFAANLEHLIKNVELRRELGRNAKEWVLANRHYHKTVQGLYEYYHELRLRKAKEKPYDPEKDKLVLAPANPLEGQAPAKIAGSRAKRKVKKAAKAKGKK